MFPPCWFRQNTYMTHSLGYSMRLELTRVYNLHGFQLIIGLYGGHSSLFQGVSNFTCFNPHCFLYLIRFFVVSVRVCVCAPARACVCVCLWEWFSILLTVIFSLCVCVSMYLEIFFCVW